jgi:hypothetical protein
MSKIRHMNNVWIRRMFGSFEFLGRNLLALWNVKSAMKTALPKMMQRAIQRWVLCLRHVMPPSRRRVRRLLAVPVEVSSAIPPVSRALLGRRAVQR